MTYEELADLEAKVAAAARNMTAEERARNIAFLDGWIAGHQARDPQAPTSSSSGRVITAMVRPKRNLNITSPHSRAGKA
jgi:hypothetical protein